MLRVILFDVDGTLVDSVDLHARCWQEAFARYGKQVSFEKIRAQIGKGGDQLVPYFLPEEEVERYGEELSDFRSSLFQEQYMQKVRPFPKVRELFARIGQTGKRIALASSAKEDEIDHYIELLNVGDLIELRTTKDDVENSKPEPDIFAAAMQKLGIESPREALVVGDSPFDAEAAGRLTIPSIGVMCGGFDEADLRKAGVFEVYASPEDLLLRFDQTPFARDTQSAVESGAPAGQ